MLSLCISVAFGWGDVPWEVSAHGLWIRNTGNHTQGWGPKDPRKKPSFQSCPLPSTGDSDNQLYPWALICVLSGISHSLLEISIGKFQYDWNISNLFLLSLSLKLLLLLCSLARQTALPFNQVPSLKLGTYSWVLLLCHFIHHQVWSLLPSNKFHTFLLLSRPRANAFGVTSFLTKTGTKISDPSLSLHSGTL